MRPITQSLTFRAAVGNAVCASQTPSGAGALTINGANATAGVYTAPDNTPRHLTITTNGNESTKTFTVTGTDRHGAAMSFSTLGASSATTTTYPIAFNTITSVTVSAATAAAVTIGFAAASHTGWIPLDRYTGEDVGIQVHLSTGAGLTFTLQKTMSDLQSAGFAESDAVVTNDATVTGTASAMHMIDLTATGVRFLVTSFTAGTGTFTVYQK
jgi:hypothetical protein